MNQYSQLIEYYCSYQRLISGSEIVTDKELGNIMWVGLLANLFPSSKFIYIERNSLDNCTSILQKNFSGAAYSCDPLHILQAQELYKDKADFWQELFPDRFVKINYEALVTDFENSAKTLFDALEISWEDGVLEFHKRVNSVRTPSISQVRNPINTRQKDKWRSYQFLLSPAIEQMIGDQKIS